ncbi:hypothetical protein [Cardinium endosymbiont of Nabis limbatus]|uniref:hypothetical protein n=1 Tax=Cardinium endosymbiont of Nabis limbatus TaxID=3066217 RepID=UPI003AF3EA51
MTLSCHIYQLITSPIANLPPGLVKATIDHLLANTSCIASYRHENRYCFDLDKSIDEETFKKKVLHHAAEQPIFYGEVGGMYSRSETNYFILGMIEAFDLLNSSRLVDKIIGVGQ